MFFYFFAFLSHKKKESNSFSIKKRIRFHKHIYQIYYIYFKYYIKYIYYYFSTVMFFSDFPIFHFLSFFLIERRLIFTTAFFLFVLIPSRYLAKADCRAKPGGAYFLSVGDTVFSPPTTDARLTLQFISLPTFHLEVRRILVFL